MPSRYFLAAPVLGIVWPSMAMALWWGAAWGVMGAVHDEQPGGREGGIPAPEPTGPAGPVVTARRSPSGPARAAAPQRKTPRPILGDKVNEPDHPAAHGR